MTEGLKVYTRIKYLITGHGVRTFSHFVTVVMASFTTVVAFASCLLKTYFPQYIEPIHTILCGLLVLLSFIASVFRALSPRHRMVVAKKALDGYTDEVYASIENDRPMSRRQRKARRVALAEFNDDFLKLKEQTINDMLRIGCLGSFLRGSSYRIYQLQRRIESARFHLVLEGRHSPDL